MNEEQKLAVNTPKHLRTDRQKEIIFGDCRPNRDLNKSKNREAELLRRLEAKEPLSKADAKEARRIKREQTKEGA